MELLQTKPPKQNLLCGKKRTHNRCQIHSSQPVIDFTETSVLDIFEEIEFENYMEEVASITIDEVCQELTKRKVYACPEQSKLKGSINYSLGVTGDVNVVLFMIDLACEDYEEKGKKIFNPIVINAYMEEAIDLHENILARLETGNLKFKPRSRSVYL